MCGITGLWHLDGNRTIHPQLIQTLTDSLRHRGPDDEGYLLVNTHTGAHTLLGGAFEDFLR